MVKAKKIRLQGDIWDDDAENFENYCKQKKESNAVALRSIVRAFFENVYAVRK
jgi:hypothetical protein